MRDRHVGETLLAQRGIVGWLTEAWNTRRLHRERSANQLQLVETLSVGPRRQLMLVRCGEEHYLVGAGQESIGCIVRVQPGRAAGQE